jgi:hypothetical protein
MDSQSVAFPAFSKVRYIGLMLTAAVTRLFKDTVTRSC